MNRTPEHIVGETIMGFSGRCACGAVRYTVAAEPIRGFQCQCSDCQRDTGTGHSSVFVFARNAVSVTGEVREIARTADSGAVKRKGFCPNCGSPIYNKPEEKPEFIGIYVGTLDDASTFKPSVALFCSRGYAWDHLDPDIPKLSEWHPGSREMK